MARVALPLRTPAENAALAVKATSARQAKLAARKALHLRRDFADEAYWTRLARALGVRQVPWTEPPTQTAMRRVLRNLDVDGAWYCREFAAETLLEFTVQNPTWPLRAWMGIVMEAVARARGLQVAEAAPN